MIILRDVVGHKRCMRSNPTTINNISSSRVSHAQIEYYKVQRAQSPDYGNTLSREWNEDTVLSAEFNGNLLAGNMAYLIDQLSKIKLKRRTSGGELSWLTLKEYDINEIIINSAGGNAEIEFAFDDITNKANTTYEYAVVPVLANGDEGNFTTTTVDSDFYDVWICEANRMIPATLNQTLSTTRNFVTSVTTTLGRRYPFVNKLGKSNYLTGQMQATFVPFDYEHCGNFDLEGGTQYREIVDEILTNGKPKLIKYFDGRMWLAAITGEITCDESGHYLVPIYSFNFTTVGNPEHQNDLYNAGIIDVYDDEIVEPFDWENIEYPYGGSSVNIRI